MLNTKILSNIEIKPEWLQELKDIFPELDIVIAYNTASLPAKRNVYFNANWGDFDWVRSMIGDADVRCFLTSYKELRESGIEGHYGMYDVLDTDLNYDFYIGLPMWKLDDRAVANGFKSNFAWIFVHEFLHGAYRRIGTTEPVHDADANGDLKLLLYDYRMRYNKLTIIDKLLNKIQNLYEQLKALPTSR